MGPSAVRTVEHAEAVVTASLARAVRGRTRPFFRISNRMSKSLGFWSTWSLVVGAMIGSGVFLLPAVLAPYGSFSLAGWAVAATGTLFVALSLGSLARRIPRTGGPYVYTRAAFGDLPAFLIAWGYWIAVWSAVAALAVAFSGYMSVFIPSFASVPAAGAGGAIAILWLLTGVNTFGIRAVGFVQLATTLIKLLPLLLIAGLGFVFGDVTAIRATNPDNEPLGLLVAGLAALTMWAYVGMETATVPAEDVLAPERTIPRALVLGTLTATAVYVLATVGVMALVPAPELGQSSSPFADAAGVLFGPNGAILMGLAALVSIAGALNAAVLVCGQIPRAAARDGLFPARFGRLNSNDAPSVALFVSAGLSSVLILMNYSRGLVAAFTTLILLSTLTTLAPYAVSAAADLTLQRRDIRQGEPVQWQAIVVAAIALAFSVFAMIGAGIEVLAYGVVLLLAGLPMYMWLKKGTP